MEVALTFGSVGDIIQLCQLAVQLGRAVGMGCGAVGESAKEYQELRHDLSFFVRILMQVVETFERHESSTSLADLDQTSKSVVNQTASLIQDALDHFQSRYKNSLHPGGPGNKLKDVYKKLEWSTRERERIRCLREKLQESIRRLQLLTSLAARKSARVDNAVLVDRVTEVQTLLSKTYASQEEMLHLIQQRDANGEQVKKLDELSQLLSKQDKSSLSVLAVAGDALSAILQVKDLLFQVSQDVINVDMVFNSTHLRPMDPTNGLPATIEDALGRQVTIPAEWLGSLEWEALYALLSCHFKGQNGHEMVMRREYALEESVSGRDLDPERPLHLSLRRGMKINMSMVFQTAEPLSGACPRCKTEMAALEGITVQCPMFDCGMWYRVQKAATGDSNQITSLRDPGEFGTGSTILGKMAAASIPANPADFQRVRLFRHEVKMSVSKVVPKSEEEPRPQYTSPSPLKLKWGSLCTCCESGRLEYCEYCVAIYCPECNFGRLDGCAHDRTTAVFIPASMRIDTKPILMVQLAPTNRRISDFMFV